MTDATLADALAVTPQQLTTMTPPQIDALHAALHVEYDRLEGLREKAWDQLYRALLLNKQSVRSGRGWTQQWPMRRDEAEDLAHKHLDEGYEPDQMARIQHGLRGEGAYADGLRKALAKLDAIGDEVMKLNRGPQKVLSAEFDRRGGWSRFFSVEDGHIHAGPTGRSCSTVYLTTRVGWNPELSGLDEAAAVAELGPTLCTVCYSKAPTEWKQDPEDIKRAAKAATECPGSREYVKLTPQMARRVSKYAECPVCGKPDVSVTSNSKLRAHKPKK